MHKEKQFALKWNSLHGETQRYVDNPPGLLYSWLEFYDTVIIYYMYICNNGMCIYMYIYIIIYV